MSETNNDPDLCPSTSAGPPPAAGLAPSRDAYKEYTAGLESFVKGLQTTFGDNQTSLTKHYKAWKGDQAKANTMEIVAVIVRPDGGIETLTSGLFSASKQMDNETLWNGMIGIKNFIKSYWESSVASANLNNEGREPEYDDRNINIETIPKKFYMKKKNIAISIFTSDIIKGDCSDAPFEIPAMQEKDAKALATELLTGHSLKTKECVDIDECKNCQACIKYMDWPPGIRHVLPSKMLHERGEAGKQLHAVVFEAWRAELMAAFGLPADAPPVSGTNAIIGGPATNARPTAPAALPSAEPSSSQRPGLIQNPAPSHQAAVGGNIEGVAGTIAAPSTVFAPTAPARPDLPRYNPAQRVSDDQEVSYQRMEVANEGITEAPFPNNPVANTLGPTAVAVAAAATTLPFYTTEQLLAQRQANCEADANRQVQASMGQAQRLHRSHEESAGQLVADAEAGLPALLAESVVIDAQQAGGVLEPVQREATVEPNSAEAQVPTGVGGKGSKVPARRGRPLGSTRSAHTAQQGAQELPEAVPEVGHSSRGRVVQQTRKAAEAGHKLPVNKTSKKPKLGNDHGDPQG